MPNLKHQAIVQILRDDPHLVTMLLGHIGFITPSGSYPLIVDSDLSHRTSRLLKELRGDNVFLFPGLNETVAVVVEVQTTRPNDGRQRAWPCYVTSARAVHGCKAYMLVIATSRAASDGSVRLIEIGQPDFRFRPFVAGHVALPSPGGLVYGAELMMLNILTGRLKLSTHEARMFALASIAPADPDLREEYVAIILKCSSKRTRQALEELMSTTWKSPFIDAFRAEGRAEGRTEGRVEEAANDLFAVLAARGITVLGQSRALVSACTDLDQLREWLSRAATATTIEEVFAA
jgi:hypothetical protein